MPKLVSAESPSPIAPSALVPLLPLFLGACAVTSVGTSTSPGPMPQAVRNPVFTGQVTLGGGRYEHDIDGGGDDRTRAGYFALMLEGGSRDGFGGGVRIESVSSDDDLFEGSGTSSQATGVDIAPYFLWRAVDTGRFRMPVRVGPWINVLQLDEESSDDQVTWVTVGLRAAVAPEVALLTRRNFALSIASEISLAAGGTAIEVESGNDDQTFDSSAGAFGFELGPRFRWSHFYAGFSYVHRSLSVDESDTENLGGVPTVVREFDNSFDGLVVSFGGGF